MEKEKESGEAARADFHLLRDPAVGRERVMRILSALESESGKYLSGWISESREYGQTYPGQGLLTTPYDYLGETALRMLPVEKAIETLRLRMFFLMMFNHPYRVGFLEGVNGRPFVPPGKIRGDALGEAFAAGVSLAIGDIGAAVTGAGNGRVSRGERYAQGPFVKLGRQARNCFVGSASPDVWNNAWAIATMAACHSLASLPRNGVMVEVTRQVDLAKQVFKILGEMEEVILGGREDRERVAGYWRHNVMGTLESVSAKALGRAEKLYEAGVRVFRVYSPEPGREVEETVKAVRAEFGGEIEIFAGQVVEVGQGKSIEERGADGIVLGVGGGGRCITGVRSGSVVEWPELVWKLRGEIGIPMVVEGGASDHVAVSLLLGVSGIGVSRAVAGGTVESPGGFLYCSDDKGRMFKPYGGEASARTKYVEGKLLPFEVPSFVEGETGMAEMSYVKHALPTLTYNLHLLTEDAILALVFRGVTSIEELQAIDPSPLRRMTASGVYQAGVH